jgi:hypothetical protein
MIGNKQGAEAVDFERSGRRAFLAAAKRLRKGSWSVRK